MGEGPPSHASHTPSRQPWQEEGMGVKRPAGTPLRQENQGTLKMCLFRGASGVAWVWGLGISGDHVRDAFIDIKHQILGGMLARGVSRGCRFSYHARSSQTPGMAEREGGREAEALGERLDSVVSPEGSSGVEGWGDTVWVGSC